MAVDVAVELTIRRRRSEVASYAGDPANAPQWYVNIDSVTWRTAPPVSVGSRMDFVAHFLGRPIAYTYEVTELVVEERLVMRTQQGPFPMETIYTWESVGDEATRMGLRNRGNPRGFAAVTRPLLPYAMRRAMTKDLQRLQHILEDRPNDAGSSERPAGD